MVSSADSSFASRSHARTAPRERGKDVATGTVAAAALTVLSTFAVVYWAPWESSATPTIASLAALFFADLATPQFYGTVGAGIGLLAGVAVSAALARRRAGRSTANVSWVIAGSLASLALSDLALAPVAVGQGVPSFVPLVSAAPALVLHYGGGARRTLVFAFLGALTTSPLAVILVPVLGHLGLPAVVGSTLAMAAGTMLAFLVAPLWERRPAALPSARPAAALASATTTARSVLRDFSAAQFLSDEWASVGLLVGATLAVAASGSQFFELATVVGYQAIASIVGVVIWRKRIGVAAATYIPVVSVAPIAASLTSPSTGIALTVLSGIAAAPLAAALTRAIGPRFHPVIANTLTMAVLTTLTVIAAEVASRT